MAELETVDRAGFMAALAAASTSYTFREVLARIDHEMAFGASDGGYAVIRGPVRHAGPWVAPAANVLVLGAMRVDGLIDLSCPRVEEGGSCIVVGDVRCTAFANDYAKATIIDGDLVAREAVINAFSDSGLWVTGTLRTRFFFGEDIWAEVGIGATMQYGDGYCLPIGYADPVGEAIRPRHGAAESRRVLAVAEPGEIRVATLLALARAGKPILR